MIMNIIKLIFFSLLIISCGKDSSVARDAISESQDNISENDFMKTTKPGVSFKYE